MTQQIPTIREIANNGVEQTLADVDRSLSIGDFYGALIQQLFGAAKVQSALFTATGATQAVTFAGLGMTPPTSLNYVVSAESETAGATVDESTKTLTGFTILGTTNTQPINIIVTEPAGPLGEQVTVTSSVGTLAAAPKMILDVIATAGTSLGRKVLKIGPATVLPAAGEVVWDGASSLRFNAADAVTSAKVVRVPTSGPVSSFLNRLLGQRDG